MRVFFFILFVGFIFGSVGFTSSQEAHASMICSSSFSLTRTATHRRRQMAKKQARKRIRQTAHRRCRKQKIVYMARWKYHCRKRSRRFRCRAVNRFRCCTVLGAKSRSQQHKRSRRKQRRSKPKKRYQPARQQIRLARLHRMKVTSAFRRSRTRRHNRVLQANKSKKKRRRVVRSILKRGKKGWCSHKMKIRGYGRALQSKLSRKKARKQVRKKARKKCRTLRVSWMGRWKYRCTQSGRKSNVCRAQIAVRCCQ